MAPTQSSRTAAATQSPLNYDGQVVLLFEGGGALGAYQVGVYQALHEWGVEPDWIVGTSIGAINAALIVGNKREQRLDRLKEFWERIQQPSEWGQNVIPGSQTMASLMTITNGISGFFEPNFLAASNPQAILGVEQAGFYSAAPLLDTLDQLVNVNLLRQGVQPRISLGTVNVSSGQMRYFDSDIEPIALETVMASGALPPAFPAVIVNGQAYWDGGVFSNTPFELIMNQTPRRNSLIFAAHLWHGEGPVPGSVWEAIGRSKEIQYASRVDRFVEAERKLHRLRHVITELGAQLPAAARNDPVCHDLLASGCATTMHLCRLQAPRLAGEDALRDIDFSAQGIEQRRQAGYADTVSLLQSKPWTAPHDPLEGIVVHGNED
jgi:NTE family protein